MFLLVTDGFIQHMFFPLNPLDSASTNQSVVVRRKLPGGNRTVTLYTLTSSPRMLICIYARHYPCPLRTFVPSFRPIHNSRGNRLREIFYESFISNHRSEIRIVIASPFRDKFGVILWGMDVYTDGCAQHSENGPGWTGSDRTGLGRGLCVKRDRYLFLTPRIWLYIFLCADLKGVGNRRTKSLALPKHGRNPLH